MQRKRSELVPIAEAFSDLSGPVAALRDASPQALHHYTRFDQVNQLVTASEADPDLGFMARTMALPSSGPPAELPKQAGPVYAPLLSISCSCSPDKTAGGSFIDAGPHQRTFVGLRGRNFEMVIRRDLLGRSSHGSIDTHRAWLGLLIMSHLLHFLVGSN